MRIRNWWGSVPPARFRTTDREYFYCILEMDMEYVVNYSQKQSQ